MGSLTLRTSSRSAHVSSAVAGIFAPAATCSSAGVSATRYSCVLISRGTAIRTVGLLGRSASGFGAVVPLTVNHPDGGVIVLSGHFIDAFVVLDGQER